jgi:glycosyltransferase involved in cell wall biosynthesis
LPVQETVGGVIVHRVWSSRFGRKTLFRRSLDYFTFHLGAAWCLLRLAAENDVVVAKTDPPLISITVWLAARFKGARTVNWLQDLFPEVVEILRSGWFDWVDGACKRLRNLSLRDAALNIAIGDRMARRLLRIGIPAANVRVVHNWADGKNIVPRRREENRLRRKWAVDGNFVVGYSGNMGLVHEFKTILGAINYLKDEQDLVFLFIGYGAQRIWMKSRLKGAAHSRVVFKSHQPRHRIKLSLCVPDVHLVSLYPAMEGLNVPSKFYGIAAAGRPTIFIGDPDGEIPAILGSGQCGITVRKGDVDGLARAILELKTHPGLAATLGANARQVFEREYEKAVALPTIERLLREVMAQG